MIRILVADDHAIVRDGLRLLLNAETDLQVIAEAANGREAVQMNKELEPDLVIMDIGMPELNGIDATERIRTHSPNTQVIILSMYSTGEHIVRALKAGALGYLLKSSAGSELVRAVRMVAAKHRYLSLEVSDTLVSRYLQEIDQEVSETPLATLSAREREVLQLTVEGKSPAQIAALLFLSRKTVVTYKSRLMRKLAIDDLPTLTKFAIQHGLTLSE
ncbi:response regulator [Candidatus Bipolaricaulota bacterium]